MKIKKKFYTVFIVFSCFLILSYIAIDRVFFINDIKRISLENATKKIYEREEYLETFIKKSKQQLLSIRESKLFNEYLKGNNVDINDLFFTIIKSDIDMMQLRFIDNKGQEKVRVERKNQNTPSRIIKGDNLQDKSERDYFLFLKNKPLEEVYYSRVNLNIENKIIEFPYKPVIRVMVPVKKDNIFYGVLVINYFMEEILNKLFDAPFYDMILIEKNGSILRHYDDQKSWSSILKKEFSLEKEFGDATYNILENNFFANQDFVSKKLNSEIQGGLILIIKLKKTYQSELLQSQLLKYGINGLIVLILALIFIRFFSVWMNKVYKEYYQVEELNKELYVKTSLLEDAQKELQIINNNLEERIIHEVEKNNKQQMLLMQHNKLAQMGEMLSMIAHQWRQPLSAISTAIIAVEVYIASKKHTLETDERIQELIEIVSKKNKNISDYVQFLSATIDDFRSFYKTDQRKNIVSVSSLIDSSLYIIERTMKSHGIKIIIKNQVKDTVKVYKNELIQVILNILKNSEDNFLEKKIVSPTIYISINKFDQDVMIMIEDNGGGIDQQIINKIFEPYFSTKLEKNGTGLGLYMSKIIVEDHHSGVLSVLNSNNGVLFKIIIPLYLEKEQGLI